MALKPKDVELVTVPGEPFTIIHLGDKQLVDTATFLTLSKLIMDNVVHFHAHSDRDIFSVTRTPEELTIVCRQSVVPSKLTAQLVPGWKAFRIKGVIDLSTTGIISHLTTTLADKHIAVFVTSTHDTDYVFVKTENYTTALDCLRKHVHKITEAKEPTGPSTFVDPHSTALWTCPKCSPPVKNPHTLDACAVCSTPRPVRPQDPKYSEFSKGDVEKPSSPLPKPEYFKLPAEAIDPTTFKVNPQALKEAQELARKRHAEKANGSSSKKGAYLALSNQSMEAGGTRHTRSHSTGNAPNPQSNYSTMSSNAMADGGSTDGKPKKKDYLELESKEFGAHINTNKLHPSPGSSSTGGHGGITPLRGRNDSLSAGGGDDAVFDMPVLRPNFTHNYAPTISSQDFPDGTGPPIQRTNATIGGMLSGGGGGGVDAPPEKSSSLSRSDSQDGTAYASVSALDGGRWGAVDSKLDLDIERKPYYRPDCGRSGAQKALESKPPGTFLFRLCSDRQENDMHGNVFVLNYINAVDKKFSNVKIYRFQDGNVGGNGPQKGWCMHRDRKGTVYPNLEIIIRAINFGAAPQPLS